MYVQNISDKTIHIHMRDGRDSILLMPGVIIDFVGNHINVHQVIQLEDSGDVKILPRSQVEIITKIVRKKDISRFELMDIE